MRTSKIMRRLAPLVALCAATILLAASPASAAVQWSARVTHAGTNMAPGGIGEIAITVRNLGLTESPGGLKVKDTLPDGLTATGVDQGLSNSWSCPGLPTQVVTCTYSDPVLAFGHQTGSGFSGLVEPLVLAVSVAEGATGSGLNTVTAFNGGAVEPTTFSDPITFSSLLPAFSTPTGFGFVPGSFAGDYFDGPRTDQASTPVRQAGSHPYELRDDFTVNAEVKENLGGGNLYPAPVEAARTLETRLPQGFYGLPENTPKCPMSKLVGTSSVECDPASQVGTINLDLAVQGRLSRGEQQVPVFNMVPPKGTVAMFGFSVVSFPNLIYATVDPADKYAILATVPGINEELQLRGAEFSMWGVPSDPSHDPLRWNPSIQDFGASTKSLQNKAFLTIPSDCGIPGDSQQRIDSWNHPGVFSEWQTHQVGAVEGCEDPRMRFEPDVSLQPTTRDAGAPTGLQVDLKVPQKNDTVKIPSQLYDQSGNDNAIATPPIKRAVVTLPRGMTISPSAAQGLGNCSPQQIGLGTNQPVTCPDNSRYGTISLHTPVLPADQPMEGNIYIAKQNDNPFHDFLALYFVIQEPARGLLVKIPGKAELDPVSGQIKTTFDDLPQFPVSDFQLNFKSGVRAALVNPSTCGQKTISAEFFSWAEPNAPITRTSSYDVTQKPDGSPCVNNLGERPFKPQMEAGTASNSAGSYSPFSFRLTRSDDDQEFSQLGVTMPKGLLANISGISKCPEASIRQAGVPTRSGNEEAMIPSCPASSLIGTTEVGAGVGVPLTYVPGKAYLAGPYKGAPLSMVVITPALVGPYDLGVIAVRSGIDVNPETAQASVTTDPFPQIFKGIPVRIRDIRVNVNRANTIINPTNCDPMEVKAHVTGTGGDVNTTADDTAADLSQRFQAANCANLGFKPNLAFRLKGGTHRGDYPALSATLRARPGDANIARTAVTLPHSEFLAQEHIRTVCTRVQFAADNCPAASIYGHAAATSPLFDETLQGPVYLRSSSNPLPDLVAKLDGEIDVVLLGRIDSIDAQIRNTFDVVPDAPVTKFTLNMQGGKKSLLVNSRNLCKAPGRAEVKMVGQNGKTSLTRPVVANSCKKARKGKHKRAGKRRG